MARGTLGVDLVSLGFIAGLVAQPTQIRIRCAPIVTIVCSEVIAMRESGANRIWVISWVFPVLLAFGGPKIVYPPTFFFNYFFSGTHSLPYLGSGNKTASPILREGLATLTKG